MIKVKAGSDTHTVVPTIFPDGTSQVWHLPQWVIDAKNITVVWHFEAEREIMDLLSLRQLTRNSVVNLHIPFMPYARQDKPVDMFKNPKTDNGVKKSAKGLLRVNEDFTLSQQVTPEQEKGGLLETVYLNGKLVRDDSLTNIRARLLANLNK